jgi:hypothetical protein
MTGLHNVLLQLAQLRVVVLVGCCEHAYVFVYVVNSSLECILVMCHLATHMLYGLGEVSGMSRGSGRICRIRRVEVVQGTHVARDLSFQSCQASHRPLSVGGDLLVQLIVFLPVHLVVVADGSDRLVRSQDVSPSLIVDEHVLCVALALQPDVHAQVVTDLAEVLPQFLGHGTSMVESHPMAPDCPT